MQALRADDAAHRFAHRMGYRWPEGVAYTRSVRGTAHHGTVPKIEETGTSP